MKLLADFNYDQDLFNINPDQILKSFEFLHDQKGWYQVAKREIVPLIELLKQRMPETN